MVGQIEKDKGEGGAGMWWDGRRGRGGQGEWKELGKKVLWM